MYRIKNESIFILLFFILAIALQNCGNDFPPSIYNPDEKNNPAPVISGIAPDSAFAGVDTLTISGKNFSNNTDEVAVYFNGQKGTVISSSLTSVKVISANVISDSVRVQLRVTGALKFAEYMPYKLEPIFIEIGGFDDFDEPYGLALDKSENLYVSLYGQQVQKIEPDGTVGDYSSLLRDLASHMKWGPDGGIYYVFGLQYLLKINPGGGGDGLYAILPGGAFDLDFDKDKNIYCAGGGNAIYRVDPNKIVTTLKEYPNIYINSIRIYNNYVYVAGKYSGTDTVSVYNGVWRNEIIAGADSLGGTELVLDFGKISPGIEVQSITFSEDGELYLGTTHSEGIFVMHSNGNVTPMYSGILGPDIYTMVWGNGNFIYVTRRNDDPSKKRVLRINARKKGSTYFGRL